MKTTRHVITGLLVGLTFIIFCAACTQQSKLEVAPAAITFGTEHGERRITLTNNSARAIRWKLDTVGRVSEDMPWIPTDVPWLIPSKTSGELRLGTENILLVAARNRLAPGNYTNVGVRITTETEEIIIPVSLVVRPLLRVSPERISLFQEDTSTTFTLENVGDTALPWQAHYFEGTDPTVTAGPLPATVTLQPPSGTLVRRSSISIRVGWVQPQPSFGLRLSSLDAPGHDAVVLFVFAEPLKDLVVSPEILTVYASRSSSSGAGTENPTQPNSSLRLQNVGGQTLKWTIFLRNLIVPDEPEAVPLLVEPSSGDLPAGQTAVVKVSVKDPVSILTGTGNYELLVRVPGLDGVIVVPIVVESVLLPVVIASEPPNPNVGRPEYKKLERLDFGRTDTQKEFWVVNIGPLESKLFFNITHDDVGVQNPLIASVQPMSGDTNKRPGSVFFIPGTNDMVDAKRVIVTIDRSVMKEDVEYRDLYIEAWNEDRTQRIEAVEPWRVEVRVERPPLKVEGALNRSRPPFLMRFVFLLRDTVGRVIPTRTEEDRSRIRFEVSEDDIPLDLNEVSLRVDGPETLKANIVVMLDYTGSMYMAGTSAPTNPKAPGEILAEIREAVAMFLDDLPAGYRVALMFHNDRQTQNRLIYPFSTDRESLKRALRNFNVPPQLHGTSDIWDALVDAAERIVSEDGTDILPFDDADLRAVFFITDGNDNSSTTDAGQILTQIQDSHVRLYPLVYNVGSPVNYADVIELADKSGGHLYNVGDPENLVKFLGHRRSLVLEPVPDVEDTSSSVSFKIKNAGKAPISWNIFKDADYPWITTVSPSSGTTVPGAETLVTITTAPTAVTTPLLAATGALHIISTDGEGKAIVTLALNDDRTIEYLNVSLYDEAGEVWNELRNQIVLTYVTPLQRAAQYNIRVHYRPPTGGEITGFFEEDSTFYMGDVRAGQISMHTAGIQVDRTASTLSEVACAEVFVRADYVPRKVSGFRMRFMPLLGDDVPNNVVQAFAQHEMAIELAPEGLLVFPGGERPNWRVARGMDGVITLLTSEQFSLPYAASGNLLRITFKNLLPFVEAAQAAGLDPEFYLDMRVDNTMYYAPQSEFRPSQTVYFLYPSGPTNPGRLLRVGQGSDLAGPARTVNSLMNPGIDPEAPGAWDTDDDGIPDFHDPFPNDDEWPRPLVQPSSLKFTIPGIDSNELAITNNRLDTLTILNLAVEVPDQSPLLVSQFIWSVSNSPGVWTDISPNSLQGLQLMPGERLPLRLRFIPLALDSGRYAASIRLQTDLYEDEIATVEIKL